MPEPMTYAEAAARLGVGDQTAHAGEAALTGVAARLDGASRAERTGLLEAATAVLTAVSFVEALTTLGLSPPTDLDDIAVLPSPGAVFAEFVDEVQERHRQAAARYADGERDLDVLPRLAAERFRTWFRRLAAELPEAAFRLDPPPPTAGLEALAEMLGAGPDRARLAAIDRPILPDTDPAGGRSPTLAESFVATPFRLRARTVRSPADEAAWQDAPPRTDLEVLLATHLTGSAATRAPTLVLGQPGAGKTSLLSMLAARLPADDFTTVHVRLRATTSLATWAPAGAPLPVLMLDGLDELALAAGAIRADYLEEVAAFQRQRAAEGRPVVVIVTCRTLVADVFQIPRDSVLIRIEPFHAEHLEAWLSTWNRVRAPRRPLTTGRLAPYLVLAQQPLLLVLLAVLDAGDRLPEEGIAAVYDRVLDQFVRREIATAFPAPAAPDLVGGLEMAAFAMLNRGAYRVTEAELIEDLAVLRPEASRPGYPGAGATLTPAVRVLGRFLAVRESSTFEFLHAVFCDYLVARAVHRRIREAASERWFLRDLGRPPGGLSTPLFALLSYELLSRHTAVRSFLESMARELSWADADLRDLFQDLLASAERGIEGRFADYLPRSLPVPVRHARFGANLLVLAEIYAGHAGAERLRAWWTDRVGADLVDATDDTGAGPGATLLIGHVPADRAWAEWLAFELQSAGHPVAIETWDVRPDNFVTRLTDALRDARQILVVASASLYRAGSITAEWTSPQLGAIPITVVRVDDAAVPVDLGRADRLELTGLDAAEARRRLLAHLGRPALPGGSPEPARRRIAVLHADADHTTAELIRVGLGADPTLAAGRFDAGGGADQPARPEVLSSAVTLLVVSPHLLASGYLRSVEAQELRRRRNTVVPVIARACVWEHGWLGRLTPLPPAGKPIDAHPGRDEAVAVVVEGTRLLSRPPAGPAAPSAAAPPEAPHELGDVFLLTGTPTVTFVEPAGFRLLCAYLAQPGLAIVLEGPAGIGKTTLLRRAAERERTPVRILKATRDEDLEEIRRLPQGHEGVAFVDDFHWLPAETQAALIRYARALADGENGAKLVLAGAPGAVGELVGGIRRIRPSAAPTDLIEQMIAKGEAALNVSFRIRGEIAVAAAGSLQTAQTLCWHLAYANGIRRTADRHVVIDGDLIAARTAALDDLHGKFRASVRRFAMLDGPDQSVCVDLLKQLGDSEDGEVPMERAPAADQEISRHLSYDPVRRRLIAYDPQLLFYLRHQSREALLELAGNRPRPARTQVFVCYSRRDTRWRAALEGHLAPWRDRLVWWTDAQLRPGDLWDDEIKEALARTRVAILLISSDMLASEYIRTVELPLILAAHDEGGCAVVPLLVRPSNFALRPDLNRFQGPNTNGVPLTGLSDYEQEVVLAELAADVATILS